MDWNSRGQGQGTVADICKYGNTPWGCMKCLAFLQQQNSYKLSKTRSISSCDLVGVLCSFLF